MAINTANLSLYSQAPWDNTQYLWNYTTTDSLAVVNGGSYLTGTEETLHLNDLIAVTASDGSDIFYVNASHQASPVGWY